MQMDKLDLVSVVIPVYKVEKYIVECVDSVIGQSYPKLEIILIDDGSPDNCGKICDEYAKKDKRIIVIHKKNEGLSAARNTGIKVSSGKYIYFLDSDDYIVHNAIEILVKNIEKDKADFVFFDAETIYENFNDPEYKEDFIRKYRYKSSSGDKIVYAQLRNQEYYSCVPLLFFRKSFLIKNRLFFVCGIIHEDELFSLLAFLRADKVGQVYKKLYIRRLRANSIMAGKESVKSVVGIIRCIKGYIFEMRKEQQGSLKYEILKMYIKKLFFAGFERYILLNKSEKMELRASINQLHYYLYKLNYLYDYRVILMVKFPAEVTFYKKYIKSKVKRIRNNDI